MFIFGTHFGTDFMYKTWSTLIAAQQQPTGSLGEPIVNCWDQNYRV